MTTSHWFRSHAFKSPDVSTDVLIVGGGYAGLSTAYWLTEMKPGLKVTVLERGHLGSGASGRNAGFLTKGSVAFYKSLTQAWGLERAQEIYKFAEESVQLAHQRILNASPEMKYERTTSMTLYRNQESLAKLEGEGFDPKAFNFFWQEPEKLPSALRTNFIGGFENGPEHKINPAQLLASLRKNLESKKVQIIESTSAFKITEEGVLTEVHQIKAKQVVLALNAYLPQFHESFKGLVTPCRAQMLAVELESGFDCPSLYYDPAERIYFRRSQDNVLLVGGKRLLDEKGETGDFEKLSPIIQQELEKYLSEMLGIKYRIVHRWSGTMGFTGHELPIITKIKAPLDAYVIGGFSGHGMGFGFRSGMEMAELVTGKKDESFFSTFKTTEISL